MTLDIRINGQSLREVLNGPPAITDQLNAVCRTLAISVQNVDGLVNYLGQPIELWYGGKRWFYGFLMRRGFGANGAAVYLAYDPLYFMKRNPDDWYFKNMTATQGFKALADRSGVRIASLANTGAILPPLHYFGAEADKVGVDLLARTKKIGGKLYWYRYKPDADGDGLILFEKKVPEKIWAFQVGINLLNATLDESIEETATVIKLVNRETGRVITRTNTAAFKQFGQLVYFEEVDRDQTAALMEKTAQDLLEKLSKPGVTMTANGINPDQVIPQLYSGDAIYVEEPYTGMVGGYYIRNVTQTFISDKLVDLAFDLTAAPDIPDMQFSDADKPPQAGAATVKTKSKASAEGKGVQQGYSEEVKATMARYGLIE